MKKNDIYEIEIDDIGNDGEGIGHIDEIASGKRLAIFVKDALPGDIVKAKIIKDKKSYAYGRLEEITKPSPDRVEPRCRNARACGGCTLQHLSYEKQLEYKQKKVIGCLERIGGIQNAAAYMEPITGMFTETEALSIEQLQDMKSDAQEAADRNSFSDIRANICENGHWNYRNKAQFPVGYDREGKLVAGFYAGRTHSIIPCDDCNIQAKISNEILKDVLEYMRECEVSAYDEISHTGLVRHILIRTGFTTGEHMVCIVINGTSLPKSESLIRRLEGYDGMTSISININREKTNKILGDRCKTIWGKDYITDYIGNVKYQISPLSFYQVNPIQTKVLYEKALEYAGLTGGETVWDLYCGIGTISLFLAGKAERVYGVEIVPQAIDDARRNAALNDIENVLFYVGKAEEVLPREYEKNGVYADVIVVDPPRKGCDQTLLETIIRMSPKRVVYVSCDAATLARDLKYLLSQGYKLEKAACFDQFCHCGMHIETVAVVTR
jgi:23S rRNA (uracil1939-C5)-methyltransferase